MNRVLAVSIFALAFGIGCVAATVAQQFVVPPARAGSNPVRWEYSCPHLGKAWTEQVVAKMNQMGQQGWELTQQLVGENGRDGETFCFKRPLP